MFFYYQVRNHHYKTEAIPQVTCPLCHTAGHLHLSILQKYTWLLGPVAPSSKYAIAWCTHCNQYISKVKWTDEMDGVYGSLKRGLKTPGRLYRGMLVFPLAVLALIGGVLLFVKLSNKRHENNTAVIQEAVAHPQPGDIFQITHTDGQSSTYTYFKVARSTGDSVYFHPSTIEVSDMKKWDDIPTDAAAYEPEEIAFSISQSRQTDMFTYNSQPPEYGLIWGLWKNNKLYKKY